MTLGPGSTWARASISTNSSRASQRLRSTSSRCAMARTPPKPCRAIRLNARKSSVFEAGRAGGDGAASFMAAAGVPGRRLALSSMDLERVGVDDVRRPAFDEGDDVGEGRLEVELVAVLLDVA